MTCQKKKSSKKDVQRGVPFTLAMLHPSLALWLYTRFLYKRGAGLTWRPGRLQEARFHLWALLSCCWSRCGARGGGRDAPALPAWLRALRSLMGMRTILGPNSPTIKYSARKTLKNLPKFWIPLDSWGFPQQKWQKQFIPDRVVSSTGPVGLLRSQAG